MDESVKKLLLDTDPDFILLKRFDYSLAKALQRYPDGLRKDLIAQALGMSEVGLDEFYANIVKKLKKSVKA